MSRINWDKANKRNRISRSGFEQVTEFGDAIDKARAAAILENKKLASESARAAEIRAKKKKKKGKSASVGGHSTPSRSVLVERRRPKASALEKRKNAGTPQEYIDSLRELAQQSGRQTAYDAAIDGYLKRFKSGELENLPRNVRSMVEALVAIRLTDPHARAKASGS